jgi:hypothetical protein
MTHTISHNCQFNGLAETSTRLLALYLLQSLFTHPAAGACTFLQNRRIRKQASLTTFFISLKYADSISVIVAVNVAVRILHRFGITFGKFLIISGFAIDRNHALGQYLHNCTIIYGFQYSLLLLPLSPHPLMKHIMDGLSILDQDL